MTAIIAGTATLEINDSNSGRRTDSAPSEQKGCLERSQRAGGARNPDGGAWLDPRIAGQVLEAYRRANRVTVADRSALPQLTDRERDVLRLVGQGATNAEIAAALFIGEATVKTHLGNILSKLNLRDRPAAIVFAHAHGVA